MLNAQILLATALLVAYFFENELKSFFSSKVEKEKVDWVIGILSSSDNFERRAIIRQTWLSYLDDLKDQVNVKPYFIVGKHACNLTASIRSNDYSCEEVRLVESVKRPNFLVNKLVANSNLGKRNNVYKGFVFEVNHDITINRLGLLNLVDTNFGDFNLLLQDSINPRVLARISQRANQSSQTVDYVYFDLESPLKLKKGFVGQLWMDNVIENYESLRTARFQSVRNDDLNLVKIIDVAEDGYTTLNRLTGNVLLAVSFDYTLTNRTDTEMKLSSLGAENKFRRQSMDRIQAQLISESSAYNDIKLLDDVVDTYRNLPDKLLKFLQYVDGRYDFRYFIKADDDSFVNIPKIFESIRTDGDKLWFGKFRRNWYVNRLGKWFEPNYQAIVYPPFPCGSAYMLSSDLVSWLSTNSASLFRYQGEDVSMGIWLAAILPNYEDDKRWFCGEIDNGRTTDLYGNVDQYFSFGQLSTQQQVELFKLEKHLQN